MAEFDFAISIGGEAGQGIATPGNVLARICARRGLQFFSYNSYQSIIRGGHIFLTTRISTEAVASHGDKIDLLICLNQELWRLLGLHQQVVANQLETICLLKLLISLSVRYPS